MMNVIKEKIETIKNKGIIEYLFLIGIAIFTFSRAYQYSLLINLTSSIKTILRLLSIVFIFPKVVFQNYNKKDILMVLVLFLFTFMCIGFGGDKSLIILPTILIGCKEINIKKVINVIFIIIFSSVVIHFIAFIIKYYQTNAEIMSMFHLSSFPIKNTVMFGDNNMFAIRYTCCIMQYLFLTNRNTHRYTKCFALFLLSIFVLFISQSKASFIICVLLLLFIITENSIDLKKSIIVRNTLIIFSILCTFIIVFSRNNNTLYLILNKLLTGRPTIYNTAIDYIGINIFPSINNFINISSHFGSYMIPDNSYISTLLKWGVLISFILVVISIVLINNKNNECIINIFVGILSIWFIVEYLSIEYMFYFIPLVLSNNYFKSHITDGN